MISLKDISDTTMSADEIHVKPDETDLVELIQESEFHGVVKMMELLEKGETKEVMRGLTDLRRMFKAQVEIQAEDDLERLMAEVILWQLEEDTYRTPERSTEILNIREEIAFLAKRYDFVTDNLIRSFWADAANIAFIRVEDDYNIRIEEFELTWEEVFEQDCEDYERR